MIADYSAIIFFYFEKKFDALKLDYHFVLLDDFFKTIFF